MARNYKLKKARPFLTFLVVLLVLCLLAMIFAFVWKLSDGLSDWSWFDTGSETEETLEDVDEIDAFSSPDIDEYSGISDETYGYGSDESFILYID